MSFFEELKRRNVVKVAVLYVIASWLVLQVVDVLSSLLPVPDWTGSLVFILLVAGSLPVLIFSWVYELTPEGLKRQQEVDRSRSITHETGRRINVLITVLLMLAISVVVLDRLVPERSPMAVTEPSGDLDSTQEPEHYRPDALAAAKSAPARERSIAVLPFVNMSADPEQEYFSDGLSEELLNLLARVPDLTVASRTSAFYFKGKDVTISDVAQKLDVRHILEGSVRKSGDRVRITAQLIDAERDVHLWSETWERTLDDVFAIQEEIAASVVAALKVQLLGAGPEPLATDTRAYTLYLQATHLERQGSAAGMMQAIELFEQALSIDPDYVPAWNGLGSAYSNLTAYGIMPAEDAWARDREATERALAIDPDNARAHASLAWYHDHYTGNRKKAAALYRRAMELGPNNDVVLNGVANFLMTLGRAQDAIALFNVLAQRDPINPKIFHNIGQAYLQARNLDAAASSLDKVLTLSPGAEVSGFYRGFVDYVAGDCAAFIERVEAISSESGNDVYRLVGQSLCYPTMNREHEAAAAMDSLELKFGERYPSWIAAIHARQGRPDSAFAWLDRAYSIVGPGNLSGVAYGVMFESLHDDPRYQPLLQKLGLAPEQVAAIEFDVKLPD